MTAEFKRVCGNDSIDLQCEPDERVITHVATALFNCRPEDARLPGIVHKFCADRTTQDVIQGLLSEIESCSDTAGQGGLCKTSVKLDG